MVQDQKQQQMMPTKVGFVLCKFHCVLRRQLCCHRDERKKEDGPDGCWQAARILGATLTGVRLVRPSTPVTINIHQCDREGRLLPWTKSAQLVQWRDCSRF